MKTTTILLLFTLACLSQARGYSCGTLHQCLQDEAFLMMFGIGMLISLVIGCVLCKKCMERREQRETLKNHMAVRRREFATLQGLDLYQSHKMQRYKTIHV